jgi:hypothetical protein
MMLRYTLFWFVLMIVAIINGILRQAIYTDLLGELSAHQVSTVTGILLVFLAVWLINKIWRIESHRQAIFIGLIWFVMTILFEFGFGHYVMNHPWERLVHDYNIIAGRIWLLFLLSIIFIPSIVYRLSNRS